MDLSDHGYEVLLWHLTPADAAALRLVSRSWQALVDRCLTSLRPFAVTTGFFSLNSMPCLVYRSPFQQQTVRHQSLDYGPSYPLHALAGQFTVLHTLSVDCSSKSCADFEALRLLRQLRRLHLAQFSFDDSAVKDLGHCTSLHALHLDSQQAMLQLRSLRHLSGLQLLQELVLQPRGYVHVLPDSAAGLAVLGQLTSLTHLHMSTAIKPPRVSITGELTGAGAAAPEQHDHIMAPAELHGGGAAAGAGNGAAVGHPLYFSAAATRKLSDALGQLKGLKALRLTGLHMMPAAVAGLTQLAELSLERVGWLDRPAVASLNNLKQLTALTIITAADALDIVSQQPQQQPQDAAPGAPAAAAVAADNTQARGDATAAAAVGTGGVVGMWLPLLDLPALQEVVLGCAHRSQQLNLTGSLTECLSGAAASAAPGMHTPDTPVLSGQVPGGALGRGGGSSGASSSRHHGGDDGGGSSSATGRWWWWQEGQPVSVYVCPTGAWSDLSSVRDLHNIVVVRSWHSAAITAVFPSFAATAAAFMAWRHLPFPSLAAADAARSPTRPMQLEGRATVGAAGAPASVASLHLHGVDAPPDSTQGYPQAAAPLDTAPQCGSSRNILHSYDAGGAVGVFHNDPNHGCYIPSMPQLMVLALRPSMGALGPRQKMLVAQLLQLACIKQLAQSQQQALGTLHLLHDSAARCLLLAQLRSSMHYSKLLVVLGASATALTRLELTVDQSWPSSVLGSLGKLQGLRSLSVLKLDCGRQQPADAMWEGLSCLTSLRWLCLRWLDRLPVAFLAPLTNLEALQLKNIDKPPGVAQLAEVLHGMPHLTALAIEGSLLDAEEDWLRAMVGLMRHGRWTSSWVEHILCREYRLRVLGSITGALLMSALLHSPKWPEMVASALLAAVAGAIFVMAVLASLLQRLFDPQQLQRARFGLQWQPQQQLEHEGLHPAQQAQQLMMGSWAPWLQPGPKAVRVPTINSSGSVSELIGPGSRSSGVHLWTYLVGYAAWLVRCMWVLLQFWLLGGWLAYAIQFYHSLCVFWCGHSSDSANSSCSGVGDTSNTWLSFVLRVAALRASFAQDNSNALQQMPASNLAHTTAANTSSSAQAATASAQHQVTGAGAHPSPAGTDHSQGELDTDSISSKSSVDSYSGSVASTASTSSSSSTVNSIVDPGSAFRRLRFLSLRRCTLSHSNNSVSNKLWQLSVLASQLAPGLGSQLVAVALALVLWPLAVAAAISRIAATSGRFEISSGGYSYNRHSSLNIWAWGWDLICGLLQGAANRVEGAAARCGPVVAVASCMPELRFLDVTWLNLEPWELHAVVQLKQVHYLGLSRQQVGVVMSREAVFARNCSRNRRQQQQQQLLQPIPAAPDGGAGGGNHGGIQLGGDGGASLVSWSPRLVASVWWMLCLPLYAWPLSALWGAGKWQKQQQQQQMVGVRGSPGFDAATLSVEWPSPVLIESPTGFDEALERELAA